MRESRHRPHTGYAAYNKGSEKFIRILITAGPTQEPIDPVRFISNRSTGYMGYNIAEEALNRKHEVTLISGPVNLTPPKVKKFIPIRTADELLQELRKEIKKADCLIMAAAVGDFKAGRIFPGKIKRTRGLTLKLVPNIDILKSLAGFHKRNLFVGFSLETEGLLRNSYNKLRDKNLDLIVANNLKKRRNPFGNNKLDVYLIDREGCSVKIAKKSKAFIAHVLLDKIEELWYLKNK